MHISKQSGKSIYYVEGKSMYPTLISGDKILVEKKRDIYIGDIVAFYLGKKLVVHRVVRVKGDMLYTKGDNSLSCDSPITVSDIQGVAIARLRGNKLMTLERGFLFTRLLWIRNVYLFFRHKLIKPLVLFCQRFSWYNKLILIYLRPKIKDIEIQKYMCDNKVICNFFIRGRYLGTIKTKAGSLSSEIIEVSIDTIYRNTEVETIIQEAFKRL